MKREILHILMVSFLMVTALSGGTRAGVVDLQPAAAMVRIVTGEVDDGQLRGQTSGAGVIISAEGAVLTTRQAIRMADGRIAPVLWALMPETEGTVSLNRAVRLRLIAASVETDLALLQLVFRQGRESAVPFVSLAVDDRIDYGAKVTLLGFTSANGSSIVRRQSTILDFDERNANAEWIVVAGRIDQQSTGGPVLNDQGRLVGLQTAVWQNRPVPFFGDDDFPIGLVDVGEVGYVRTLGTLIGFLLDPAAAPLRLTSPARPSTIQVIGRVRDARTGEAIPGAVIGIVTTTALARTPVITARELLAYGRSNFQGNFEASRRVPSARYLIKVVHPQYQTIVREMTIGANDRDLTIDMVRN